MSNPAPYMTDQEAKTARMETVLLVLVTILAIAAMVVLQVLNIETTEYVSFILILIPLMLTNLINHRRTQKIDVQTNGGTTRRLDAQTQDVLNGVSGIIEQGVRVEDQRAMAGRE